jgi:hypothetical protein
VFKPYTEYRQIIRINKIDVFYFIIDYYYKHKGLLSNRFLAALLAIATRATFKVDHCHNQFTTRTVGENNSYQLPVIGSLLKRLRRARLGIAIRLSPIDPAILHNIQNFTFINLSAAHAAFGVVGISKISSTRYNHWIIARTQSRKATRKIVLVEIEAPESCAHHDKVKHLVARTKQAKDLNDLSTTHNITL